MKIRSFPTYWYQKRIINIPNEKSRETALNKSDFKTKIEEVDSGPKKKIKISV